MMRAMRQPDRVLGRIARIAAIATAIGIAPALPSSRAAEPAAAGTPPAGKPSAATPAPRRPPAPPLDIRGGKIVTVTAGVIEGGTLLISGGKIEKVLPGDPAPADSDSGRETIDATDLWVLPGFVETHSHIGGGDINDMVYPTNPGLRVLDCIQPGNPLLRKAQAGGVTTILFVPGSGTNLSGFGVVMKTAGATQDEMVVRALGCLKVAQGGNPERRGGEFGYGPMGMTMVLRWALEEGRRYSKAWEAYERGERAEKPPLNLRLEPFRDVFRKAIPVLVHTQGYLLVAQTLRLFRGEFDLPAIIGHAEFDAHLLAGEAARTGAVVSNGPRQLRFDTDRGTVVGLARRWHEGGVEDVCINTDAAVIPQEEQWFQATMAVRLGLPEDAALRGLTIGGAKALGLQDRLGSLEAGKDADVVLWTGNPLEVTSRVVLTIVDGRVVYDARREPRRF